MQTEISSTMQEFEVECLPAEEWSKHEREVNEEQLEWQQDRKNDYVCKRQLKEDKHMMYSLYDFGTSRRHCVNMYKIINCFSISEFSYTTDMQLLYTI